MDGQIGGWQLRLMGQIWLTAHSNTFIGTGHIPFICKSSHGGLHGRMADLSGCNRAHMVCSDLNVTVISRPSGYESACQRTWVQSPGPGRPAATEKLNLGTATAEALVPTAQRLCNRSPHRGSKKPEHRTESGPCSLHLEEAPHAATQTKTKAPAQTEVNRLSK